MPLSIDFTGLLQYLGITPDKVVPLLVLGFFAYLYLSKRLSKFSKDISKITSAVVEIQTIIVNNLKLTLQQSIGRYGDANSPIVLKEELKPFITKTDINKQVLGKLDDLVGWLKKQNPNTGIDAQNMIIGLVTSKEIEKYLDLTKYKQYLYKKGKTSQDVDGILSVYLFEILIPKVVLE